MENTGKGEGGRRGKLEVSRKGHAVYEGVSRHLTNCLGYRLELGKRSAGGAPGTGLKKKIWAQGGEGKGHVKTGTAGEFLSSRGKEKNLRSAACISNEKES